MSIVSCSGGSLFYRYASVATPVFVRRKVTLTIVISVSEVGLLPVVVLTEFLLSSDTFPAL